jgi:hypothetical protein
VNVDKWARNCHKIAMATNDTQGILWLPFHFRIDRYQLYILYSGYRHNRIIWDTLWKARYILYVKRLFGMHFHANSFHLLRVKIGMFCGRLFKNQISMLCNLHDIWMMFVIDFDKNVQIKKIKQNSIKNIILNLKMA